MLGDLNIGCDLQGKERSGNGFLLTFTRRRAGRCLKGLANQRHATSPTDPRASRPNDCCGIPEPAGSSRSSGEFSAA